jgi:sugar/nucleoside kinase (ribokinase family)
MNTSPENVVSVVGELNLYLVLTGLPERLEPDREHLASDFSLTLGSSSAIFAHNFALLGNRVLFHSAIGGDPLGEICLARLAESGADVSRVRRFADQKTGLTVILPQRVNRYILTYPGVMAEMRFEDLDVERILASQHLHLSSFFLQRALRPRIAELFRLSKEKGLSTSLDTNDDPEDAWASDVLDVLPWVDVLLPNEREACRLAHCADPLEALELLAEKGPLVVMKRGPKGAIARRGAAIFEAVLLKVDAVDTIGAGDSFDAGFLHRFIRGASVEECLRFGNLTGAFSTTRSGGTEAFRDAEHRRQSLSI